MKNAAAGVPPRPRILATVVSYPHREQTTPYAAVIRDVRWSPDGTQLVYKMESPHGQFQLCVAKLDNFGALDALCPLNYKLNTNSRFSQWHQLACTRNTIFLYSFLEIPSAETVSNFQITFFPYSRWTNDFSPGPDRSNDV